MSRIDELIAEHCPTGVAYFQLGDVTKNFDRQRKPVTKSARMAGKFPYYGANGIQDYVHDYIFDGTFLLMGEDGSVKNTDGTPVLNWAEGKIWVNNHAHILQSASEELDLRYLYYYLQTVDISSFVTGGTQPKINQKNMNSIPVAVPPLEIQKEIVRILDTFSKMEAELEAELEARKQQYAYYADQLLAVEVDVPRVKFGDIATIVRGASPRPIQAFLTTEPSGVPWIKIGDVPAGGKYITETVQRVTPEGAAKSRHVKPGDFVLSNSMSFGRPYVSKIDGYIHDGWLAISNFEQSFVRDYLYYLLRSNAIQEEFARRAGAGTVKNLNADIVRSIVIPLPPKEVQERVVELLNRFDDLVNDISVGLPAELAARRQQYEYYRDKLLTFKELGSSS